MTDDIVTRLRGSWDCSCLYIKEHGLDRTCLDCEAADEIERLRAEVCRLTLLANLWEAEFNAAVDALTTDRNPT